MKILFQGDSITDVGRNRENDTKLGEGYPLLIKSELGYKEPKKYEFFNRGISGNRIVDVYSRVKKDIINLKPDVMSILIGVNDVWHELDLKNGIDAERFFDIYDMLIVDVKKALPNIKIMLMGPFVLKGIATTENWEYFNSEVKKRAEMAKKIAEKHNLTYIELQEGFDELAKKAEEAYWLMDGVHPTPMGHQYIKEQWLKAFNSLEI